MILMPKKWKGSFPGRKRTQIMRIDAVILHLESTLIQSNAGEAEDIRARIGCPDDISFLEYIRGLSATDRNRQILASLEDPSALDEVGAEAKRLLSVLTSAQMI